MAAPIVIGGGVVGLGLALLLANDCHNVTVLERDPEPPFESVQEAFERWERTGVELGGGWLERPSIRPDRAELVAVVAG